MQFNVAQLLKDTTGATREYEVHESANLLADVAAVAPYTGRLRLMRINGGILATARIDTSVQLTCSRCLVSVVQPLHIEFAERFCPTIDVVTGNPVPQDADEQDTFLIDEFHTLDITEAVRQYALVSLPLSPLCRDDCLGLCPICGQDRNVTHCECEAEQVDPRLSVLGQLLADTERS